MSDTLVIQVEVCAASPQQTVRQLLALPAKSLIRDLRAHPDLCAALALAWDQAAGFAVFGEKRTPESRLVDGDRVEILRPLLADPKEARRLRANLAKAKLAKAKPSTR